MRLRALRRRPEVSNAYDTADPGLVEETNPDTDPETEIMSRALTPAEERAYAALARAAARLREIQRRAAIADQGKSPDAGHARRSTDCAAQSGREETRDE